MGAVFIFLELQIFLDNQSPSISTTEKIDQDHILEKLIQYEIPQDQQRADL